MKHCCCAGPRPSRGPVVAGSDRALRSCNWFRQGLADPNRLQLIATAADGCPIGQIRFDRQPLPKAEASVDLSLDRCARGFGLAADLVSLGLAMEQTWGPGIEAVAEVLTTNAANACFSRAGFVQDCLACRPVSTCESLALPPGRITSSAIAAAGSIDTCQSRSRRCGSGACCAMDSPPCTAGSGDVPVVELRPSAQRRPAGLHRHHLVVHESALPQGQGWSPMTWQIVEGASTIPITLFEAVAELDTLQIYLQKQIDLQGHGCGRVVCRFRQRWSFAWPGLIATGRWWPLPSLNRVRPVTTAG